jgi:hypothetical protein
MLDARRQARRSRTAALREAGSAAARTRSRLDPAWRDEGATERVRCALISDREPEAQWIALLRLGVA